MISDRASREPVWLADEPLPERPPLDGDATVDACVIGAGIAGLSAAYFLARGGRSVVVVDDGPVAGGMSSYTSAHLTAALDDRLHHLERVRGEEVARLAAQSHSQAIDAIEGIVIEERINCDFSRVDGHLFLAPGDDAAELDRELEACRRAGLEGVEKIDRAPGLPFDTGPCLRYPRQAEFHPVRYLAGLARAVERHGGRVHGRTRAVEVNDGEPCTVTTPHGVITAGSVIVATNIPIRGRVAIPIREAAYMTYVIAARIPKGSVKHGLYWDTGSPYHYVRVAPSASLAEEILIVGGGDHRTGQSDDPFAHHAAVAAWARERFPMIDDIGWAWSGQVVETMDGLAFIGRNPGDERVFIATGDSGMGLTHGTIAGIMLADLSCGRPHAWESAYDPGRVPPGAAWRLLKEAVRSSAQYVDHLKPGDVEDREEIPRGGGAVLLEKGHRIACHRDATGELHEMSAICPHLGCIVHWNPDAATWDCPCHGSRFDPRGEVINGPANSNLGPVSG